MKQNQEIKGFTLLELLVVITLIGLIAGIGYPNFMSWREDRQIRSAAERLSGLITGINTQTQRGNFPFTQLLVTPGADNVSFTTKGKNKQSTSSLLNAGTALSCVTDDDAFWDVDPFNSFEATGTSVHFANASAVCFSKNAENYASTDDIFGNTALTGDDGRQITNYIIICSSNNACNSTPQLPAYMVEWSRFGNVSKFKYNGNEWIRQ